MASCNKCIFLLTGMMILSCTVSRNIHRMPNSQYNTATSAGGGVYIHTEVEYTYNITSQPTEVTHCQLANNRALTGNGGAIIYMGHVARERVMILGSTSLSIITLSVC